MFGGWSTLVPWAMATEEARIGLIVGANTFREPTLTAKIATTLDHVSGGRAILGIGAAWFETEHTAFGFDFGDGFPERLRWLGEALPVMCGMLHGERPTAAGPRYHATAVRNDPPPIQQRLPILVGGGGEKVREKERILVEHCERESRDPAEIERTTGIGTVIIRDSRAEAEKAATAIFEHNGSAPQRLDQPGATPEDLVEQLAPYGTIGYRHLIAGFPAPYDEESMTRLITEVKPKLEA